MTTIDQIKNECLAIIAQAEKAAPGPWFNHDGVWDRSGCFMISDHDKGTNEFIAASRSFTPLAAKALLTTIELLELNIGMVEGVFSELCAAWEESK